MLLSVTARKETWFECEGFGYEVVQQAGIWAFNQAVLYVREARRTHTAAGLHAHQQGDGRIKFDRNANVESDLAFWARFLSQGRRR